MAKGAPSAHEGLRDRRGQHLLTLTWQLTPQYLLFGKMIPPRTLFPEGLKSLTVDFARASFLRLGVAFLPPLLTVASFLLCYIPTIDGMS